MGERVLKAERLSDEELEALEQDDDDGDDDLVDAVDNLTAAVNRIGDQLETLAESVKGMGAGAKLGSFLGGLGSIAKKRGG